MTTTHHADRDRIKSLAEEDFIGLFESQGGRRQGRQLYCPLHKDRSPSAEIWEGQFHCFACNIRLDPFAFLMRVRGFNFREALQYLSRRYRVPLNGRNLTHAELLAWEQHKAAAEEEARALVAWRDEMLAALCEYRDECLEIYHRAVRLLLRRSMRHPRAHLWADVADFYEDRYREIDRGIDTLRRARWADLLPYFRARSIAS